MAATGFRRISSVSVFAPDDLVDGRYRVVGYIARGGMATVYEALDTRLDRHVALKVMHPALAADDTYVARFAREARAAARLSHPNIVAVHDQGEDDGRIFLVMELVRGRTLRQVLDEDGALSPRAALDIASCLVVRLSLHVALPSIFRADRYTTRVSARRLSRPYNQTVVTVPGWSWASRPRCVGRTRLRPGDAGAHGGIL